MRHHITTVLLSVGLLSGCVQHQPVELLPKQAAYDSDALERKEPVARYADFERQYREGVYQDPYWPLEAKYEGLGQLIMPPSVRPEAAWGYVSLGKDSAAKGDYGSAARAYWAALELVSRTIASRPDRERIVRAAYEGLEEVAKARGQRKWERLMRFCSRLADTYLASSQAETDNTAFYTQMDTIKKAQLEVEAKESEANSQYWQGMLLAASAGLSAASAAYTGNSYLAGRHAGTGLGQAMESKANYQEVADKIKAITEKQNVQYRMLRVAVTNDAEEITAGNSFVANEFLFYLENAQSPEPYLTLLKAFARNKPQLLNVLTSSSAEGAPRVTPEFKTKVQAELVQIEKFVARYERRGKVPPAEVAQVVWPD